MPPAMAATTTVSLRELADLAIGTPEVGAVNFTALHTLVVAMLRNLNLQEVRINFQSPSPEPSRTLEPPQAMLSAPQLAVSKEKPRASLTKPPTEAAALESQVKGLGGQVQDLSRQLKTVTSQVQGIVSHVQHLTAPISELDARHWLEEEPAELTPAGARASSLKIAKGERASVAQVSQVSQAMELLREVVEDVKTLKEAQEKAQELPESSLAKVLQRIDVLEKIVRDRDEFLNLVSRKMSLMPVGEEVTMVTWEELEQAITDGWRASQGGSETTTGLPKRKGHPSLTSDDTLQGGVPIRRPSADPALDSPGGHGSDQTLSGISGIGNPSEGVTRERSRGVSATAFPGREQHPRARDEAGLAKSHHPSMSRFRVESDRRRTRELPPHSLAHLRKDEQEAHPGPGQQDLPSATVARDQHHQVYPDQHGGVDASQSQIYPRPDQHGLGPLGTDLLALHPPSTYPHGVVPLSTGQLAMMPPGMDEQGLLLPGMDRYGMVPPSVPGTDQRGLQLPSTVQPGMVPLSTNRYGTVLPGIDQQLGVDQHGLLPFGIDQHGFFISGMDQQGLVLPGMNQHGLVPHLTDQHGLVSPGLMQVAADQQGFVQPSLETSGFVQPGTEQHDVIQPGRFLVQPGMGQRGLVQPGAGQPGAGQPGMDQRGLGQPGMDQRGLGQPGMDQRGLGQPGMDQRGLGQPGMDQRGLGQPGMDQRGLGQPGMDQRGLGQPGMDQRGLGQPGMDQRGLGQPGMDQRGLGQPGMDQRGLGQPGMDQRGLGQPGMDQRGLGQPGMDQRGLGQPGMDQRGLGQPGMDQRGLGQPGMDQRGLGQPGMDQRGLGQPGMDQRGLGQPGMDQRGLGQPGMDQRGLGQPGMDQRGLGQPGMDQRGLGQPGMDQRGLGQPGMDQRGLGQPGMDQRGLGQPGMDQRGLGQPGMDQRGLGQPGMDQRGLGQPGMDQHGLGQPGMDQRGLGQPGMDQRGLGQPGMDQRGLVQPGVGQPVLVQPGAGQPGLLQPGMDQRGLVQRGADPRGFFQPGAYPPGLVQPGAYPPGLVQSSAYPRGLRGLVQPGIDQHGLRQPGTEQRGLIPPGTELRGFPTFHPEFPRFLSHPDQHGVIHPGRYQHGQVSPLLINEGLAAPGIGQEGLSEAYQQGLSPHGTDQRGLTPLSTRVGSAQQDQQHLISPGPDQHGQVQAGTDQHDRASSIPESRDLLYPGPHGPGVLGVDPYVQTGLDPKQIYASGQPGISVRTAPSQAATFARSTDSLNYLYRVSSEKSDFQSERHDSLDKLAPSFPMAVETFRLMGELIGLYVELKENMKELDEVQAGQSDLEKIQHLLGLMVKKSVPADLEEQLKTLKSLTKEVRQEKAKLDRMQRVLEGNGEQGLGEDMKNGQLGLQLGILRVTVADIEKELAELRESQERGKVSMEHSVSEASLYLQDQLDKLRTIIESMLASSSTLLSMSMAPHKTLATLEPGQIDPEATCPACSLDLSHQVSTLVQRYEQLQDMVNNLAASRPSKKAKLQSQVTPTGPSPGVATHAPPRGATAQRPTERGAAGNPAGFGLGQVVLDGPPKAAWRAEGPRPSVFALSPVPNPRGRALTLCVYPTPHRQLLAHFHCLSCDRPLETTVTGQFIPVTPVGPALPGHRSIRPYTVFELEQVRQQSRNLKLGSSAFARSDLAHMERSVGRLRTMHSKMLMDIEKVQIHFGGSIKASSQMIRELLQAQCLSSPCYKRMPETADYTYSSVPRRCGGSHTLTYPYRRSRLQHLSQGLYPTEEVQIAMKHHEVDILGLDGHIYKGRMDTRLPGILTKDTSVSGMSKHKAKQSRPHVHRQQSLSNNGQLPSRPQSAQMLAGNSPAPPRPRKDRPMSSEGHLAQPNAAHPPSPSEMEMHMDVPPGEGLEEPTRGPRSATAQ
ncbi:glutamine-rich protein 2 [Ailuropoda melanoleuca]|uniref:glutamine-rich protein 2 n=1 Tax=Ailuropoda melanoleuca TaxID=9646 RepID=UPI001493F32C|nr:glutamine-rich protein 2 [Ailuropoda melanoleuca]